MQSETFSFSGFFAKNIKNIEYQITVSQQMASKASSDRIIHAWRDGHDLERHHKQAKGLNGIDEIITYYTQEKDKAISGKKSMLHPETPLTKQDIKKYTDQPTNTLNKIKAAIEEEEETVNKKSKLTAQSSTEALLQRREQQHNQGGRFL